MPAPAGRAAGVMAMGAEKKTRLDKYVAQALEIPRSEDADDGKDW